MSGLVRCDCYRAFRAARLRRSFALRLLLRFSARVSLGFRRDMVFLLLIGRPGAMMRAQRMRSHTGGAAGMTLSINAKALI